ncbi:MAG: Dam family site-specific DNA-(adenine-N6)-methyltransferase [Vampirovibrionales bacterium]|nr:Dam family site-specific DNA-(adenine-N6)-methyltransferase [Vampirovibrionales bacterium]
MTPPAQPKLAAAFAHASDALAIESLHLSSLHLAQALPRPAVVPSEDPSHLSPLLKWAGGKRWLLPVLQPLWNASHRPKKSSLVAAKGFQRRLVEPFCGGLAVALGLNPKQALLNDANPHLIHFYQQVQQGFRLTVPLKNEEAAYYAARERFNQLIKEGIAQDTPEAAEWFYYLNRTGYNGLCRFNKKGLYNVPFGKYRTIGYKTEFSDYQPTLAPWQFASGDFSELAIDANDFVYADPPYDVPFTQYAADGFTWADQVRLAEWLSDLPCPVVASNQATDRILDLYRSLGFEVQTLAAPRRIACTGDRTPAQEMLAVKGL